MLVTIVLIGKFSVHFFYQILIFGLFPAVKMPILGICLPIIEMHLF